MNRVLVIGGGPAGLAAAIHAAGAGARATVLERNVQCGVKLLATGGGHCNLGNNRPAAEWPALFGPRGRFIVPALERFPLEKYRSWLAELGVPTSFFDGFHLFPESKSAKKVRDALVGEAVRLGVSIQYKKKVDHLLVADGRIRGVVAAGEEIAAERVIVAAGGKSLPASGSTWDGCRLAGELGHRISPALPGLVGLRAANLDPGLAGLVLPAAEVSFPCRGRAVIAGGRELLLTHVGISGPAVLDISASVAEALAKNDSTAAIVRVRWQAGMDKAAWLEQLSTWRLAKGGAMLTTLLREYLPERLARWLCRRAELPEAVAAAKIRAGERDRLVEFLDNYPVAVTSTEGWDKAMITRGGVDVREVDPKTLESRLIAGVFFAGETLDVDGPCGGYNLHWAFASGVLAGRGNTPTAD